MDQVHRLKLPWIRVAPTSADIKDVFISPHTSPGILAEKVKRDLGITNAGKYAGMKGDIIREYGDVARDIWDRIESGEIVYINNLCAPGGREKRFAYNSCPKENMLKSRVVFVDDLMSVIINAV
jgi:hypothetical protein